MNSKLAEATSMSDQVRSDILTKFTEMGTHFNDVKAILAAKQPFEDVGVSIDEVQIKFETFK
jgi:hypothetical protein